MHLVIESRVQFLGTEWFRIANRNAKVEMLKSKSTGKRQWKLTRPNSCQLAIPLQINSTAGHKPIGSQQGSFVRPVRRNDGSFKCNIVVYFFMRQGPQTDCTRADYKKYQCPLENTWFSGQQFCPEFMTGRGQLLARMDEPGVPDADDLKNSPKDRGGQVYGRSGIGINCKYLSPCPHAAHLLQWKPIVLH